METRQEQRRHRVSSLEAFEYLILRAFELEGADVTWPYDVKRGQEVVEQIDGVIYTEGLSCLIEAKDYHGERVNIEPIAKLRNQLLRRPASVIGAIFSRNGFTDPATILATYLAPQTVLLWNETDMEVALRKERMTIGLRQKFRYAVEQGLPDYDLQDLPEEVW